MNTMNNRQRSYCEAHSNDMVASSEDCMYWNVRSNSIGIISFSFGVYLLCVE